MSAQTKPSSFTIRNKSKSAGSVPPGELPKNFPEKTPLSDDGVEVAKREAASPTHNGAGEDPMVESGLPENDPERPRETVEEQSNR